ncbi:MAG: hypothetical protein HY018_12480 [Hydrogenophilales bacterium]|nr:hypothetical protein [Hydrogenophilales bacterium]
MKALKWIYMVTVSMGMACAFAAAPARSDPGKGWDIYNTGQGERIAQAAPDQPASSGFDAFQMGMGEPIHAAAYQGNSQSSAGQSWDIYHIGSGEPLR